jgi:cold shock CspA family protein
VSADLPGARVRGTISKVDPVRKFGFIVPERGGSSVFFHISSLFDQRQFDGLFVGQHVDYEPASDQGRGLRTSSVALVS